MSNTKALAAVEERPATAILQFQKSVMQIWNDKDKIRRLFAPDLTNDEFDFFQSLGIALGANPYTREIYAVKYKNHKSGEMRPASIFCGRDFYRRKAEELENYDGHYAMVVYSNDRFAVKNGIPEHEITDFSDRGRLIGAYCLVHRKNTSQPYFIFVKFDEYADDMKPIWKSKPETMIFKVAEAQGLRGAFQGTFAGTYDESEEWRQQLNSEDEVQIKPKKEAEKKIAQAIQKAKQSIEEAEEVTTDDLGDMSTAPKRITPEEAQDWREHCTESGLSKEAAVEILRRYGFEKSTQITSDKYSAVWIDVDKAAGKQ